jgi:hypothetical protein
MRITACFDLTVLNLHTCVRLSILAYPSGSLGRLVAVSVDGQLVWSAALGVHAHTVTSVGRIICPAHLNRPLAFVTFDAVASGRHTFEASYTM